MRSCPMYSSSRRGRSPASYCASSSTRAAVTRRSSIDSCHFGCQFAAAACFSVTLESAVRRGLDGRIDSFFGERPMIPQVHSAESRSSRSAGASRLRRPAATRRDLHARQPILQLEHDPLGRLLADAGNRRQPREVAALDRADQLRRLDARQDRQRQLRADAADADQPLEQLLLEQRREPVEQQRVLAHVRVNAQRDLAARLAEAVERRQRHEDVVADAVDVDDDAVRMLLENAAAKVRDHDRAGCPRMQAAQAMRRRLDRPGARQLGAGCGRQSARRAHASGRGRWRRPARRRRRAATARAGRPSSSFTICCTWCFSARP